MIQTVNRRKGRTENRRGKFVTSIINEDYLSILQASQSASSDLCVYMSVGIHTQVRTYIGGCL